MTALPDPVRQAGFYDGVAAKRLFAWVLDMVFVLVLCLLILPFTAFTGIFFFPFLMMVVGFGYRVITIANGSATWGMRLMSIELRTADGERFDLGLALLHTAGYSVSLAFALVQAASVVLMATTPRGQGVTDLVLGTTALNRRAVH
jgi:uncharacterized RDD family membrane protein YckC